MLWVRGVASVVSMLPSSATVPRVEVVEVVEVDTEIVLSFGARTFLKHSLKYVEWIVNNGDLCMTYQMLYLFILCLIFSQSYVSDPSQIQLLS